MFHLDAVRVRVTHLTDVMKVTILNTHHEKWLDDPSTFESKLPRLLAIWEQIAARFTGKDQTLLFEIFNEPHLMSVEQLNELHAKVLPIIRKQHPTRIVIIMGLKFGNPVWQLQVIHTSSGIIH